MSTQTTNDTAMPWRRARWITIPAAAVAVLGLAGCGLSDGDKQVCDAAASGNARSVYDVATLAEDDDISAQASRVRPGSSDSSDSQAMQKIVQLCDDKGYKPTGS